MSFPNYESEAACIADQVQKGHSKSSARRICTQLMKSQSENRIKVAARWFLKMLGLGDKHG